MGLEAGDIVVTAGVQALRPGQKVRMLGATSWGLEPLRLGHPASFLRRVPDAHGDGGGSCGLYFELGRSEDPAFSIKTMVVQAAWPGATTDDTLTQLTERIERKLQETPNLDYLRSYTSPWPDDDLRQRQGNGGGPKEIPDVWYEVRKKVEDIRSLLPAPASSGPTFNDEFGDTFGLIYGFTADGFTHRELRDHVEDVRSQLLHVPDVSKIDVIGAQDEKIFLEFSTERLAGLGLDETEACWPPSRRRTPSPPRASSKLANEKILVRVSGDIRSETLTLLAVNFVVNGRMVPLSDIAAVRRSVTGTPHSPCSA